MSGLEMAAAAKAAADEIVKMAQKEGWFDRLRFAFRKKHKILLLGSTGTGKTNFLDSFTQGLPEAIDAEDRTLFIKKRRMKIEEKPFIFTDTPADTLRSVRQSAPALKA